MREHKLMFLLSNLKIDIYQKPFSEFFFYDSPRYLLLASWSTTILSLKLGGNYIQIQQFFSVNGYQYNTGSINSFYFKIHKIKLK